MWIAILMACANRYWSFAVPALLAGIVTTASLHAPVATAASAAIQQARDALRQAWATDPVTEHKPWPALELLPLGTRPLERCPQAPGGNPESRAVYCPATSKILVDQERLESDYGEVPQYGAWGAGYWIAIALAQAIQHDQAGGDEKSLARNLQTNCLAGVLLAKAQTRGLAPQRREEHLAPAYAAYSGEWTASHGSPAQRAYALLTGLGISEADCSARAMVNLAMNRVPDPNLLRLIQNNPPNRATGDADFQRVLRAVCRPRPGRPCPPSLPTSQSGVTDP